MTRIEDDLLDPEPRRRTCRWSATARCWPPCPGPPAADARHRRDHPARSRTRRSGRRGSGVTIVSGGPGTGKTAVALHRAAFLLYSDRSRFAGGGVLVVGPSRCSSTTSPRCCPRSARRRATLHSLGSLFPGMSATRTDPPEVAAVKGSLRMRRVLERAVRDAVPDAPGELRLLYRGELLRLERAAAGRGSGTGRCRGAPAATRCAGPASTRSWPRSGRRPAGCGSAGCRSSARFEDEIIERPEFREFLKAWWPRLHPRHVLGWLARPGAAAPVRRGRPVRGGDPAADRGVPEPGRRRADDRRHRAAGRAGRAARQAGAAGEAEARPVPAGRRRTRAEHARRPAAGRPGRRAGAPGGLPRLRPRGRGRGAGRLADAVADVGRRGRLASWTVVGDPAQTAWTGDPEELARARDQALGGAAGTGSR